MKWLACLINLSLILGQPLMAKSQDRGGDVRLRVRDERGQQQANETQIYANSYALLIGNTKYQDRAWNDLPDVDDDLAAVREVLESRHGFKVEVALNQNRDALLRVIDQFISRYGQRSANRLLIYYSGHGYTALLPDERKMGYLVLPDAPAMPDEERALKTPPSDEEFERFLPAAITMDEIETYARRITSKHVLFVFDSCFSGTVLYKDLGTSVPTLITTEELKPVRAYLTAGNETQRVPVFSKFRRKFVAGLRGEADTNGDGFILSSELGRWVSIEVEKDTGRRQTPVFGKSDLFRRGDVVFVSPKGAAPSPVVAPVRRVEEVDRLKNADESSKNEARERPKRVSGPTFSPSARRTDAVNKATDNYDVAAEADHYAKGNAYLENGEYDSAISEFTKAIALNPKNAASHNQRGAAYKNKGATDLAINDLLKSVELSPRFDVYYTNLAHLYIEKGEYDLALDKYTRAMEINPENPVAYRGRGHVYLRKQLHDLAIAELDKANRIDPRSAVGYQYRGEAYFGKSESEKALADFTQAIILDPKYSQAYNARGVIYYNKQQYDLAIADFTKAIELNAKSATAYKNRSFVYDAIGRADLAEADRQTYEKLK